MKKLTFYLPGTPVFLSGPKIDGTIEQISIKRNNYVLYQVAYWFGGELREVWVYEEEFTVKED